MKNSFLKHLMFFSGTVTRVPNESRPGLIRQRHSSGVRDVAFWFGGGCEVIAESGEAVFGDKRGGVTVTEGDAVEFVIDSKFKGKPRTLRWWRADHHAAVLATVVPGPSASELGQGVVPTGRRYPLPAPALPGLAHLDHSLRPRRAVAA